MTDKEKLIPGTVYVGKDGSERLLIDSSKDGTIIWQRPDSNNYSRECWISTWLDWVKGVKK